MSYHAPQHRMAWEMKQMVKITISKMNQVKEKLDKSSSILSLVFETSSSWPTKLIVCMSNPPPPKESPKTAMILHPFWRLQPQQHCLTLNILWTGVLFLSLARELAKRMMLNGFNDFNKYFQIWSLRTERASRNCAKRKYAQERRCTSLLIYKRQKEKRCFKVHINLYCVLTHFTARAEHRRHC